MKYMITIFDGSAMDPIFIRRTVVSVSSENEAVEFAIKYMGDNRCADLTIV